MAKLANVAGINTFDAWRVRTNDILTRLNQFTILDGKTLYANTLIANNSFKALGNTVLGTTGKKTIINGTSVANGFLTVVNRFDVSGNTNLGAAGKLTVFTGSSKANGVLTVTNKLVVSGNSVLGATAKKTVVNGYLSANGRVDIATNLLVSANTTLSGLIANNSLGTSNYVLRTNGTSVYWAQGGGSTTMYLEVANAVATYATKASPTTSGLHAHTGRHTVSTSFTVSGNSVFGASGKKTVVNGSFVANTGTGTFIVGDQTTLPNIRGITRMSDGVNFYGNTTFANTSTTTKFYGTIDATNANHLSQTLSDGATISWNTALGAIATVTLGGNRTMAAPTPLKVGTYILHVIQDGTGSRTITWNAVFKFTAAVAPVLTTTANRTDIITFISDGTNLYGSYMPDVR